MAEVTLKGNVCNTAGELPTVGSAAPDFTLVAGDLSEKSLADFAGKQVIINIVPSFDTGTCATSVKTFNSKAGELGNTVIVNVSQDLPFAQKRFCESEGVEHVTNLSTFRCCEFGKSYGVTLTDGPLKGLLTRAIVVVDAKGQVAHTELVGEIVNEPNYDAALAAVAG
ncbi:MAG: thiol peroxidase [Mariniblastus sp.]|jgi:thiol peroxidase